MKKVLFLVAGFALMATPAFANGFGGMNLLAVGNINHAGEVENEVEVNANTGLNGAYGNSGNVTMRTGNASAGSYAFNQVNTNKNVVLDDCGCSGRRGGTSITVVGNYNTADEVENEVEVNANTGLNGAYDNGGQYSESTTRGSHSWGAGHRGHWGGSGSYYNRQVSFPQGGNVNITTGRASAGADSINVVNTNVNRVFRGSFSR